MKLLKIIAHGIVILRKIVYPKSTGTKPIAPETWERLPPEVQAYILILENALRQSLQRIAQQEQKVNELEAWLNRPFGNSSQPPSPDPPQAPKNQREEKRTPSR